MSVIIEDLKKEEKLVDITETSKVIRSTDLIPNQREIKKEDVDKFVEEFKKKHSMNETPVKNNEKIKSEKDIEIPKKDEEKQTEKAKEEAPVILKDDKKKAGRPKNENSSLLD